MAVTPKSLTTLDGTTVHQFATESWVSAAKIRTGNVRGNTAPRTAGVVPRSGRYPSLGALQYSEKQVIIDFWLDPSTVATHETNLLTLQALATEEYGELYLVTTEHSVDKRQRCVVERILPSDQSDHPERLGHFLMQLKVLDGIKYANTALGPTSGSSGTSPINQSLVNTGTVRSDEVVYTVQPTAQKAAADGQRFRRRITIANRVEREWTQYPVNLTDHTGGTGWDHAALTPASSMANGNDVEVYSGGVRIGVWADPNAARTWDQSTTNLWANLDMPPCRYWTLRAAFATTATTVKVEEDLDDMPPVPCYALFDESGKYEVVRITAVDAEKRELTVVRAQRGTSDPGSNHAAAVKLYWVAPQGLIDLLYGWTSAPAPDYIEADEKPMELEASSAVASTNVLKRWASFQESREQNDTQDRKPRGDSWHTEDKGQHDRERATGEGDMWWRWICRTATLSTDAAVASKMCLAYRPEGALAGHPYMERWVYRSPIGITQIKYTEVTSTIEYAGGNKKARLVLDGVALNGVVEQIDTQEGNASSTHTVSPTHNVYEVVFRVDPWDPVAEATVASDLAVEPTVNDGLTVDDVELSFDTDEEPLVVWDSAAQNCYQLGRPDAPATVANANGDTLSLYGIIVALNETIDIDVMNLVVKVDDETARNHLVDGTFPKLPEGTTNVTLTESGLGTITFGASSYRGAWL